MDKHEFCLALIQEQIRQGGVGAVEAAKTAVAAYEVVGGRTDIDEFREQVAKMSRIVGRIKKP